VPVPSEVSDTEVMPRSMTGSTVRWVARRRNALLGSMICAHGLCFPAYAPWTAPLATTNGERQLGGGFAVAVRLTCSIARDRPKVRLLPEILTPDA
jgi:hypothetical protein